MYINPFIAGVLTVICAEILAMFVAAVVTVFKRGNRK